MNNLFITYFPAGEKKAYNILLIICLIISTKIQIKFEDKNQKYVSP